MRFFDHFVHNFLQNGNFHEKSGNSAGAYLGVATGTFSKEVGDWVVDVPELVEHVVTDATGAIGSQQDSAAQGIGRAK